MLLNLALNAIALLIVATCAVVGLGVLALPVYFAVRLLDMLKPPPPLQPPTA